MKIIRSFTDITFITNNKLDVKDTKGNVVPFVNFVSIPLRDLLGKVINNYTYDPEQKKN